MKKIGEGWQYTVYDLGNSRVLKKFHSPLRSYWVILKTIFPFKDNSIFDIPRFSEGMKQKALDSFEVLKRKDIPQEWIGNPEFINQLDFTQDKVQSLADVFAVCSTEEIRKHIDAFIVFNKKLLDKGVIDKSFNITKNYGLNSMGEIILIDIGELFDSPELITRQIQVKAWDKHYVAGCIENEEARRYFVEEMAKHFKVNGLLI